MSLSLLDGDLDAFPAFSAAGTTSVFGTGSLGLGLSGGGMAATTDHSTLDTTTATSTAPSPTTVAAAHIDPEESRKDGDTTSSSDADVDDDTLLDLPGAEDRPERSKIAGDADEYEAHPAEEGGSSSSDDVKSQLTVVDGQEAPPAGTYTVPRTIAQPAVATGSEASQRSSSTTTTAVTSPPPPAAAGAVLQPHQQVSLPSGLNDHELASRMLDLFQGTQEETLDSFSGQFEGRLQGDTLLGVRGGALADVANPSEGSVATTFSPFFALEGAPGDTTIATRTTAVEVAIGVQHHAEQGKQQQQQQRHHMTKKVVGSADLPADDDEYIVEERAILASANPSNKKVTMVPLVTTTPSASRTIIATDLDDLECEELDFSTAADVLAATTDPTTPGGRAHTPGISILLTDDTLAKEVMGSVQFDNFTDLTEEEEEEADLAEKAAAKAEQNKKAAANSSLPSSDGGDGTTTSSQVVGPNNCDQGTTLYCGSCDQQQREAQDDWSVAKCQVHLDADTATSGQKLPLALPSSSPPAAANQERKESPVDNGDSIFKGDGGPIEESMLAATADGGLEGVEPFALDDSFDYDSAENIRGKNWDRMAEFK